MKRILQIDQFCKGSHSPFSATILIAQIQSKDKLMLMEILILLVLILLNGLFAMSEMAVVASKKVILQEKASKGDKSAAKALALSNDPDSFLSTVQIGITLIGIVAGAFGGSAIAEDIADFIRIELPVFASYADQLGFGLIVILITYLSLVIGELVPKRIALTYSEKVAIFIAPMMLMLSEIARPVVWILSKSTEFVARLLAIRNAESSVSDTEIIAMVREGVGLGAFDPSEHQMVRGVLELDDKTIREVMIPRIEMISLNLQDSIEDSLAKIIREPLTAYPIYDGNIDNIIGVVHSEDILKQLLENKLVDLKSIAHDAIFIPKTAIVANVIREFRQASTKIILVIDEYGGIEGIVSENDIIEEILGHLDIDDHQPTQRDDGTWLFDGSYAIDDIQELLPEFADSFDEKATANTLASFIFSQLGRIPKTGDKITWKSFQLEVVDMDGRRIDKVLISPVSVQSPTVADNEKK